MSSQLSAGSISEKVFSIVTARSPPSAACTLGHAEPLRDLEAGPAIALAVAAARGVDGDHDRLEARVDRLVDQRPGHGRVLEAVELEPAPARRRLRRPPRSA